MKTKLTSVFLFTAVYGSLAVIAQQPPANPVAARSLLIRNEDIASARNSPPSEKGELASVGDAWSAQEIVSIISVVSNPSARLTNGEELKIKGAEVHGRHVRLLDAVRLEEAGRVRRPIGDVYVPASAILYVFSRGE